MCIRDSYETAAATLPAWGVAKTGGRPALRVCNYRPEHVDVHNL